MKDIFKVSRRSYQEASVLRDSAQSQFSFTSVVSIHCAFEGEGRLALNSKTFEKLCTIPLKLILNFKTI